MDRRNPSPRGILIPMKSKNPRCSYFPILPQPDDVSCGPTSLHAIYSKYELNLPLSTIQSSVQQLEGGGTLGVRLGIDALKRGFQVRMYTYNLKVFDPTWKWLNAKEIVRKLRRQQRHKESKKLKIASDSYIEFIKRGGELCFGDLSVDLLRYYMRKGIPILAGLSATHLYQSARERVISDTKAVFDDTRGVASGHFVVLYEYKRAKISVADPYSKNPIAPGLNYSMDAQHVINSILLGILTYDANFLVIAPKLPKAKHVIGS